MINTNIINEIKMHAVDVDWNLAFGGKSKGNRHLFRVNKIARFLAQKEKANIDITIAGAWLHDIGLAVGDDKEPEKIRKIAEKFLKSLNLSTEEIQQIADCVESHEGTVTPKSLEAQIVHDSDVLDKMGPLGVVRHTWKVTNLINKNAQSEEILSILKSHLQWRESRLFTPTAQHLAHKFDCILDSFFNDKRVALSTISQIKLLAQEGFTTERIVRRLIKGRKDEFAQAITRQVKCEFLI